MKVRELKNKAYTPFEVAVPTAITGTRRVRKFFAKKEDALAYIVRVKQDGFHNADDRKEALSPGKLTLGECTAMWLSRHDGNSGGSRSQLRRILRSLDAKFGGRAVDGLTHRDLDVWMSGIGGGYVNKLNYHRVARRFFGWVHAWLEATPRNPMVKVSKPQGERNDVQILTPDQMKACMDQAGKMEAPQGFRMLAYLCLGGFAGIRTEEILRMDWADVDWEKGELYVRQPKRVKGWRPRWVEIVPALERHLKDKAPRSGKVFPGGQRSLYLARREMMDALKWEEWPNNCLRHSFRTYHAAEFQSIEKTRVQMGHADDVMTKYQYGTAEARSVAALWWSL